MKSIGTFISGERNITAFFERLDLVVRFTDAL